MRRAVLLVAVCLLLAGCASPFATNDDSDESSTPTPLEHEERPDPERDRLGWENSYWHDDPVAVDASDGLNGTERERVVARAMARVEVVRGLEFEEPVNVSVTSRAEFSANREAPTGDALRAFDNAKFEALYLIGNRNDSIEQQQDTRNLTVGGFYSPDRESIVLISDAESPEFDGERTLAHELVHALQDQHFNLTDVESRTRDSSNGRLGLIEGDARAVEQSYLGRCGETWVCLPREGTNGTAGSGAPSIHLGVYILDFFPYSDGPGLVNTLRNGDDWSAVDDAFDDLPDSSTEVIYPDRYGTFEPREVTLTDRNRNGWERVRPADRPDYGVLGQSALTAMFAYTLYDDYNTDRVVSPQAFLNTEGISVNRTDPFNYDLPATRGWTGDRFHAYERGDEVGYVWRLTWDTPGEAREFATEYRKLVSHWGGRQMGDGVWTIADESPFAGAVDITVDGDTVTIVGGPTRSDLGDIRRGSG